MFSLLRFTTVAVLAVFVADATAQNYSPPPTATGQFRPITSIGCFKSSEPLKDRGMYEFNSAGLCQKVCYQVESAVMGMTDGTNCWCGDLIPAKDSQVSNETCSTPCSGFDKEMCGGANLWSVYLTGYSRNQVGHFDSSSSSSSSTSSPTASPSSSPSSSPSPSPTSPPKSGGSSTVGIAVGVVVGIIVIALIVGGLLFMRYRKKRDADILKGPLDDTSSSYANPFYGNGYSGFASRDRRTSKGSIEEVLPAGTLRVVN